MIQTTRTRHSDKTVHHLPRTGLLAMGCLLAIGCLLAGCGPDEGGHGWRRPGDQTSAYDKQGRIIEKNPVAYLKDLYNRCDRLTQYRLTFYRQERLGLIPRLTEMEEIRAAFRKEPFSVKFDWVEPDRYDGLYFESVYVSGQNADKLIVRERKGVLFAKPQVRQVDVMLPVRVGRAKNPITYFGLANIVRRTLEPIKDPLIADDVKITYRGVVNIEPTDRPAHHLEIQRPVRGQWVHAKQDCYIDAETLLPAGTDLWTAGGQLDARYRYAQVDLDAELTDADFRLTEGHPAPSEDK